jgi:hypothetical protein
MRTTGQSLTIGVAILLAAMPVFWLFLATWNAIDGAISMPRLFLGWASAYVAWWLGFLASLVFARRCATRAERPWKRWGLLLPLTAGLIAIVWLEVQSWHDAKHLFPPGFFLAPYVIAIGAGWIIRMLSNNTPHSDARGTVNAN